MRVCLSGLVMLCGAPWASSAKAQQVPRFNIETTSKAAQPRRLRAQQEHIS